MSSIRIAARYAKSILDLAKDTGKLDTVKKDMELFSEAIGNRDLFLLIKSPIVKADKKLSIFKAIFGDKVDELTSSFFDIVIRKGREELLPEIAQAYVGQYNQMHNITSAEVITATEISEDLMSQIKGKINGLGVNADNVLLNKKIDPTIIGGFILQVGDKLIDASVKSNLTKLRKELVDNSYTKSL